MTPVATDQKRTERLTDSDWLVSNATPSLPGRTNLSTTKEQHRYRYSFDRQMVIETDGELPEWIVSTIQSISKLLELPPDWDTYGGSRIKPKIAETAIRLLVDQFPYEMPQPSAVPTSRGGLQLEWHTCGIDLEVEFVSATRIHGLFDDAISGEFWEEDLSSNLHPLVEAILKMSKRQ